MDEVLFWTGVGLVAGLAAAAAWGLLRGAGLLRLGIANAARLAELEKRKQAATNPQDRNALDAVIEPCRALRRQWILREEDFRIGAHTYDLVSRVAAGYHPDSPAPVTEARVRHLLSAFLDLKTRLLALSEERSLRRLIRFRVRHVLLLSRAWEKKKAWDRSPVGRAVARFRLRFFFKWIYFLVRFMDLSYWMARMAGSLLQDVVFKMLLVRWYLWVGELSIQVYRDPAAEPDVDPDALFEDLPRVEEPASLTELPDALREKVAASRKSLLYQTRLLEVSEVRRSIHRLVDTIARFHFPESDQPLYEARLDALLRGGARLAEQVAGVRDTPVLHRVLDLRLSHLLRLKGSADFLLDSPVWSWVRKYQVTRVVKLSRLLYQVVRRKHPGILFKDFALGITKEVGKRWGAVTLHDKVALEAHRIYTE
ncbi:MAG: hypothetical protein GWO19_11715 [Nitrospinaceae bacterium]|nr:hypothetical protein [Nitrospinaceae bacterium]NIS85575.1 hypothetical protein [Nitrospinaceae bacterium]NIU96791.1 hypothetical protein [Nitrospinaceae bacterium]